MRVRLFLVLLAAVTLGLAPAPVSVPVPPAAPGHATVMSRNMYLGADLTPVIASAYPQPLLDNVALTWAKVQATDVPGRAARMADEIRAARPDLVGLQEVGLWRTDAPADGPATPAGTVVFDFLDELLDALAARGQSYAVAASVTNFDGELPSSLGIDVRYTDHDVILARAGVVTANPQSGTFATVLPLPSPLGGTLPSLRGWTSVDATVRGLSFRFVNTHLEAYGPDVVRLGQTAELLGGPLAVTGPVVLVGDLNAEPDTAVVGAYAAAGFADAWTGPRPGWTCCQDEDLRNRRSALDERIDFILWRGPLRTLDVHVVGSHVGARTRSANWPSDHAGVVATLARAN